MSEVGVVVKGAPEAEPTEEEVEWESTLACFDTMSDEDQAEILKVMSIEEVRANTALNDCR